MKEHIVQFGEDDRLAGILAEPDTAGTGSPVILLLNAGIVHRVGPNRLHVKLSRVFAARGFPCLRFDLSGLGESAPAPPGTGYEQQSVADTRAAIDFALERTGERPVILAGICSGADNSYRTALEDDRIKGIILLDPYAYQNSTARISDLARRAQDPGRWKRLVGKLASGVPNDSGPDEIFEDDNDRVAPPREEFGADLEGLCRKGVQILILYTASVSHLINDRSQFARTFSEFEFGDALSVDVLTHVDHIYTELSAQEELRDRLCDWLAESSFSG